MGVESKEVSKSGRDEASRDEVSPDHVCTSCCCSASPALIAVAAWHASMGVFHFYRYSEQTDIFCLLTATKALCRIINKDARV